MAGLYIHIPFCASKCIYCDFYSLAGSSHDTGQYVDALVAELKLRHCELAEPLRTLYVGGGTPSLLPLGQFARLVDAVGRVAPFDSVEEFTVEVNPDDVTAGYIAGLKELGVNRISMGVQSFDDRDLRFINRRHTARQAIEAVRAIRQAGVHNVSIDLIYGIPGQTLDSWSRTVDQAVALGVEHISAYSLMYEQGTRLWVMRQTGKVAEVDDDTCVAMYDLLVSRLHLAGYGHYEISNFALPGYCSRHNSSYWDLTPYLGLGPAAHSYDGHVRRYNPPRLKSYLHNLHEGKCVFVTESETDWQRYDEYVMLRLRTAAGLCVDDMKARFEPRFVAYFLGKVQPLLGTSIVGDGTRYRIPESRIMVADAITTELMWDTPD